MLDRISVIDPIDDFRATLRGRRFAAIMADPPWRLQNSTGKVAPEHKRLSRYGTMTLADIMGLPLAEASAEVAHLHLWVPNALLPEGLAVMQAWGFRYKSNADFVSLLLLSREGAGLESVLVENVFRDGIGRSVEPALLLSLCTVQRPVRCDLCRHREPPGRDFVNTDGDDDTSA